jgi:hypothetical protein
MLNFFKSLDPRTWTPSSWGAPKGMTLAATHCSNYTDQRTMIFQQMVLRFHPTYFVQSSNTYQNTNLLNAALPPHHLAPFPKNSFFQASSSAPEAHVHTLNNSFDPNPRLGPLSGPSKSSLKETIMVPRKTGPRSILTSLRTFSSMCQLACGT